MYNQVNRGSQFGQSSVPPVLPPPPPPPYQQAPPHFLQFPPPNIVGPPPPPPPSNIGGPPPPPPPPHNVYLPGPPPPPPPTLSHNVMPNAGHSYAVPSQSHHGNTMGPQTPWAPGPPAIVLPPPPPSVSQGQILYNPPFHRPPLQPGDVQNLHNAPPPPPPSAYFNSNVGNFQVPSGVPPPLPSSPPPVLPAPPPVTTASSNAVRTDDPHSVKVSGMESKAVDLVDGVVASHPSGVAPVHGSGSNWDGASCGEGAGANRDEDLPPPNPSEEKTVQKIEALCQIIAEKGADIEDKICRDEFQNPEYAFLFGGDPGTEAAISHTYFLWMKKKYNLDTGWHEKIKQSEIVYSSGEQYHLHVATMSADSDMEMEDDITLSDKEQGSNYATEALTQKQNRDDEVFSMNQNIQQLQNSAENDPAKDISSHSASNFGSMGVSKQNEGFVSEKSLFCVFN